MGNDFLMASGKLQAICYKADIEAALRTKEFSGFQLLDLHDFPGQGTALVGVLDAFWDSKGYISAEEYSAFCNATVPLARLEKFVWESGELLQADIEVSHFGEKPLNDVKVKWEIKDSKDGILANGDFSSSFELMNKNEVGRVEWDTKDIKKPEQLSLVVEIPELDRSNSWKIWVFPTPEKEAPGQIHITPILDEKAKSILTNGGNVLLTIPKGYLKPAFGGDIEVGFSSIFWNTAWTLKQAPHELGLLMDPTHPVFDHFPTSFHSDYQWWDIIHGSSAIVLDGFDKQYMPLIHFIDDWFTNRKLALLTEMKVGKGNLVICGKDLSDENKSIVQTQFLNSVIEYMHSDQFKPSYSTEISKVSHLFKY